MNKKLFIAGLAAVTLLSSCGTTSSNSGWLTTGGITETNKIKIVGNPSDAKVYRDGKIVGLSTPLTIKFPISFANLKGKTAEEVRNSKIENGTIRLRFERDGYIASEEIIKPEIDLWGNLTWPKSVLFDLKPDKSAYQKDPTIPAGEAQTRVTRDNPGQTALERTIIRWYFDSEPQGGRVFWRVISSIPSEVKNTNELYLGTTPYEDTRAFNILGLTYENSRDVQIEIKVKRKGYMEQAKRFNVRQAIDQQEVSSFFDLVEVEE